MIVCTVQTVSLHNLNYKYSQSKLIVQTIYVIIKLPHFQQFNVIFSRFLCNIITRT